MTTREFEMFPKIPRLNRGMVITEKLDGTNACIVFDENEDLLVQSRNRIISPGKSTDNYGFAQWVENNRDELWSVLGPGRHYGEWFGQGIARHYNLSQKRFALFNSARWAGLAEARFCDGALTVVPILHTGPFDTAVIRECVGLLGAVGSSASPGFPHPEGVIILHQASGQLFKVTIENDEAPKSLV